MNRIIGTTEKQQGKRGGRTDVGLGNVFRRILISKYTPY